MKSSYFTPVLFALGLLSAASAQTLSRDNVQYFTNPNAYPLLTATLKNEFGSNSSSVISENSASYFRVSGSGPVNLDFRFVSDTGSFLFNFGVYKVNAALAAIDTSTDAGRTSYAQLALSSNLATMVFNDATQDPGATGRVTVNSGDVIGFFLIPNGTLADFRNNPASFAVNSIGKRWPLFSDAMANPGGKDQFMSFTGRSIVANTAVNFYSWEDLTRAAIPGASTDNSFHDMTVTASGGSLVPLNTVPEPSTAVLGVLSALALVFQRRRA